MRVRAIGSAVAAVSVALLCVAVTAGPAGAHGAPSSPISRSFACGSEGGANARTPACQAARAAGDREAFKTWDFLRVANVKGRDREMIPDGELCSAGIARFRGLDLPRADWPATTLRSGDRMTMRYRATIAHKGEFRVFLTNETYDPGQPLRWSNLDNQPFLTVTDPPLRSGAYKIDLRLPSGKTGRHLMYVIWQNSDTPDTYYSCSDVVFSASNQLPGPAPSPEAGPAPDGSVSNAPDGEGAPPVPPPASGTSTADGSPTATSPDQPAIGEVTGDPRLADFAREAPGGWRTFWPIAATLVLVGSGVGLLVIRMRRRIEGANRGPDRR